MSTTKKVNPKKLELKKERLRKLTEDQLGQINGGRKEHGLQATRYC